MTMEGKLQELSPLSAASKARGKQMKHKLLPYPVARMAKTSLPSRIETTTLLHGLQ